jgi:HPt (histidine-containing phosphotransfer) domain-containing protein
MIADENFEMLGEAVKENDVTKAFEAAHSLKGTLGNMGLTPMYEIIIQIVEPLRDGNIDGIAEKHQLLMEKYKELVAIKEGC